MIICSPQYGLSPNSPAGGEVYDEKILKGIADKGMHVEIILPHGKPYDKYQKNWNVHHLSLPLIHCSYLFNLTIIPWLVSIHKKTNFKVLRIHSPYYVGIGAWIFKKLFAPKVKLATTYFHFEDKLIFRLIDHFFIRKWDYIITISEATKKILIKKYGIPEEKITIAYPGVSDKYTYLPKKEYYWNKYDLTEKFVITFCGMLIKRKNAKFLIDLLKLLPVPNAALLIIGDGPERKSLENYAIKEGVSKNIIFAGFLEEKEKIAAIQSSDVFVFPSLMEGFGLSPVEAMACGIPTLVSNCGSLPEVVGDGAVVLPLEIGIWSKTITELEAKRELRETLAQKARVHAEKFQWKNTIVEAYKVYESLDMPLSVKKEPKINIFYQIKTGPWGGGNQFLRALKSELISKNIYEDNPEDADAIIFNSFDQLDEVINFKKKYPSKAFIHRVDGPIYLIREKDKIMDKLIFEVNESVADGTVFQSSWCREKSLQQGMKPNIFETIIHNAPDARLFNRVGKKPLSNNGKIKLIAVSWSSNWNKGFKYYDYLDKNLDWGRYEMTFVGRSPIVFEKIKMAGELSSLEIARLLKEHDIFITTSKDEPCSNALIEALSCGLSSLALNSGGHPELIGKGGELFDSADEIPSKLELIINNYGKYQETMPRFSMSEVADRYYDFTKLVMAGIFQPSYQSKYVTFGTKVRVKTMEMLWLIQRIIHKLRRAVKF